MLCAQSALKYNRRGDESYGFIFERALPTYAPIHTCIREAWGVEITGHREKRKKEKMRVMTRWVLLVPRGPDAGCGENGDGDRDDGARSGHMEWGLSLIHI